MKWGLLIAEQVLVFLATACFYAWRIPNVSKKGFYIGRLFILTVIVAAINMGLKLFSASMWNGFVGLGCSALTIFLIVKAFKSLENTKKTNS